MKKEIKILLTYLFLYGFQFSFDYIAGLFFLCYTLFSPKVYLQMCQAETENNF